MLSQMWVCEKRGSRRLSGWQERGVRGAKQAVKGSKDLGMPDGALGVLPCIFRPVQYSTVLYCFRTVTSCGNPKSDRPVSTGTPLRRPVSLEV